VDVFIPGCPPRPEAVINGIVQLLTALKSGTYKAPQKPLVVQENWL
jgi:NADH:ubiquinone oxidoreductase subunit B-like Fe-S oxidoreductase